MTANNYACKDNLWAHCGALGDALRRASEAEARAEQLQRELEKWLFATTAAVALQTDPVTLRPRGRVLKPGECLEADGRIHALPQMPPPQLSGCPKCGSDASTVRGLRKEETEAGLRVCSRCFTRYER